MALPLPDDFREFLKLLNVRRVKYLLIGGYAVAHYGYIRTTADMDVWIERSEANASRMVKALIDFGYDVEGLQPALFLSERSVVRMGVSPLRLEILTSISGVSFAECYRRGRRIRVRGLQVKVIAYQDLITNKRASGRLKDLADIEGLEERPPE